MKGYMQTEHPLICQIYITNNQIIPIITVDTVHITEWIYDVLLIYDPVIRIEENPGYTVLKQIT